MNGLHLVQVNEYDQIVIFRKQERKTYMLLVSKHSVVWEGDLRMWAKVDKSENKKK